MAKQTQPDEQDAPWKVIANEFWQELKTYEENRKMPYITTGERIGYDRGKVEGKVEGQEEKAIAIALNMLNDNLPLETIARFTGLTIAQLQQLQTQSE